MDSLDILDVVAKVRCVIYFVLEQDARDFVADEVGRLDGVVVGVEEIGLERSGSDGEL